MAAAGWARPQSSSSLCRGRQENRHSGGGGDRPGKPRWGDRSCFRLLSSLCAGLRQVRVQQWRASPGAAPKMDGSRNCTGAFVAPPSFIEIPGGSCVDF